MSDLRTFMKKEATPNVKVIVSDRFTNPETGEPMEWEVRRITAKIDDGIRKRYIKKPKDGMEETFDAAGYATHLCTECTVYPNLKSQELQDSYGVMGEENLLQEMLLPGELAMYKDFVFKINGYGTPLEELVDNAKN